MGAPPEGHVAREGFCISMTTATCICGWEVYIKGWRGKARRVNEAITEHYAAVRKATR